MKKFGIFILFGLLTGVFASYFISRTSSKEIRIPASTAWQGKHQRLFDISINPSRGLPNADEKDLVLTAKIVSLAPVQGDLFYKWVLPEGASLVSGELEDSLAGFREGQFLEKEITIQGVSSEGENKLITLQVWTEADGVKMGGAGVFATKPQEVQLPNSQMQMKTESSSPQALPGFIQQ